MTRYGGTAPTPRSPTVLLYGVCTSMTGNFPGAGVLVPLMAGAWIAARRTRPSGIVTGMSVVTTTSYFSGSGDHASACAGDGATNALTAKCPTIRVATTRRIQFLRQVDRLLNWYERTETGMGRQWVLRRS